MIYDQCWYLICNEVQIGARVSGRPLLGARGMPCRTTTIVIVVVVVVVVVVIIIITLHTTSVATLAQKLIAVCSRRVFSAPQWSS